MFLFFATTHTYGVIHAHPPPHKDKTTHIYRRQQKNTDTPTHKLEHNHITIHYSFPRHTLASAIFFRYYVPLTCTHGKASIP